MSSTPGGWRAYIRRNYTRRDEVYINRTVCDVLEEMRKLYETRNFSSMLGLIEEAQSMANRMEAALDDKRDVKRWTAEHRAISKKIDKARDEYAAITEKLEDQS